jgi:prevent-host-death family protein
MTEKTMTVTEAARNFADIVNRAYYRHEATLLLKNGEAVAKIIPVAPESCLCRDLAEAWPSLPHLSAENARALETDLAESKRKLRPPKPKWD